MSYVVIRSKSSKLLHATTTGAEFSRITLCGRKSDGWIVEDAEATCTKCLQAMVRR